MDRITIEQREQIKAASAEVTRISNLIHQTPLSKALHAASERMDELCEAAGVNAPCAWCEGCGLPFFDSDDFGTDENGVSFCSEAGTCLRKGR